MGRQETRCADERSSGAPRPEYGRLLCLARQREIEVIVASHPDRLYRRLGDLVELTKIVAMRVSRSGPSPLATVIREVADRVSRGHSFASIVMKSEVQLVANCRSGVMSCASAECNAAM